MTLSHLKHNRDAPILRASYTFSQIGKEEYHVISNLWSLPRNTRGSRLGRFTIRSIRVHTQSLSLLPPEIKSVISYIYTSSLFRPSP